MQKRASLAREPSEFLTRTPFTARGARVARRPAPTEDNKDAKDDDEEGRAPSRTWASLAHVSRWRGRLPKSLGAFLDSRSSSPS